VNDKPTIPNVVPVFFQCMVGCFLEEKTCKLKSRRTFFEEWFSSFIYSGIKTHKHKKLINKQDKRNKQTHE